MLYPGSIVLFCLLITYFFILSQVLVYTSVWDTLYEQSSKRDLPDVTAGAIVRWCLFAFFLLMTLWSLARVVVSHPGYIPLDYKYKREHMSEYD